MSQRDNFHELMDMGFSPVMIRQAINVLEGRSIEEMVAWIIENSDTYMPDVDIFEVAQNSTSEHKGCCTDVTTKDKDEGEIAYIGEDTKFEKDLEDMALLQPKPCSEGDLSSAGQGSNAEPYAFEMTATHASNFSPGVTDESSSSGAQSITNIKCLDCGTIMRYIDLEYHVAKTSHENFAESIEQVKVYTETEMKEAVKKLNDKIHQRRLVQQDNEAKEAIEKEKERRKMGQQITSARTRFQENEMRHEAEMRRKEKREAELEKKRILAEIERDKELRRFNSKKQDPEKEAKVDLPEIFPGSSKPYKMEYETCRIQIRFPDGNTLMHTFKAEETLKAVRIYIDSNRTDGNMPYTLMTTYPRRIFNEDDMMHQLSSLGLCPSSVIFMTLKKD